MSDHNDDIRMTSIDIRAKAEEPSIATAQFEGSAVEMFDALNELLRAYFASEKEFNEAKTQLAMAREFINRMRDDLFRSNEVAGVIEDAEIANEIAALDRWLEGEEVRRKKSNTV